MAGFVLRRKSLSFRQTLCPFLLGWQLDRSQRSATPRCSHLPALLDCYKDADTSASRFNTGFYFTIGSVFPPIHHPSNSNSDTLEMHLCEEASGWLIRALFSFCDASHGALGYAALPACVAVFQNDI